MARTCAVLPSLRRLLPFVLGWGVPLLALLLPAAGVAAPAAVLEEAKVRQLAEDPHWLRLLAYEHRAFRPGREGVVHTDGFYFAEDGHKDPQAELSATLAAFYAPVVAGNEAVHPACRFPARWAYLNERLRLVYRGLLPQPECEAYSAWRERIAVERVVLIYADAYMGNPASMFGHTLLRLDRSADLDRPLTGFAVNHAAQTGEDHGVVFEMRGVLGSYQGVYSVMPYYYKVNAYTDLEHRDLWEYELNLDEAAIDRLLSHLRELRGAGMPYYFFLQNCSYRLLSLLEVAEPQWRLQEAFARPWAIPSDTVRAVTREEERIDGVTYRPSRRRTLDHMLSGLPASDVEVVRKLARGELALDSSALRQRPEAEQAQLLQAAASYLEQLRRSEPIGEEARQRQHALLVARSRVHGPSLDPPARPERRPDEGHRTARIGVGAGALAGVAYTELQGRAAYHDLLDNPAGYLSGAQVSFLETAVRLYRDQRPDQGRKPDGGVELERLRLVELRSMATRNRPFPGWSWGGKMGLERFLDERGDRPLMATLSADFGPAVELGTEGQTRVYAGGEAALRGASHLADGYRAGLGTRLEALHQGRAVRWRLSARGLRFHDREDTWRLQAAVAGDLGEQTALRLSLEREEDFGVRANRVQLTFHRYL
ncbi:MAG: DUF4105 domain-containing protein [Halorhodospira sp.]